MAELVRGNVADRPWGRTFAALGLRAVTGQLTLLSEGKRYAVAFDQGAVVAATSPLAADAAVRVALTAHLVSSSQVPEISRRQAAMPNRDEIDVISELARLGPEHALRLRRRAIAQRAARTFSINQGEFVVTDAIDLPVVAGCELDVRAVIYIGARANLSEQRLSAELDQLGAWFKLKPEASEDLPQFGFTDLEQPVVERLRDGGTLEELEGFAASFLDARTVRAAVYALASYNACEIELVPPSGGARAAAPVRATASQPMPRVTPAPVRATASQSMPRVTPTHPLGYAAPANPAEEAGIRMARPGQPTGRVPASDDPLDIPTERTGWGDYAAQAAAEVAAKRDAPGRSAVEAGRPRRETGQGLELLARRREEDLQAVEPRRERRETPQAVEPRRERRETPGEARVRDLRSVGNGAHGEPARARRETPGDARARGSAGSVESAREPRETPGDIRGQAAGPGESPRARRETPGDIRGQAAEPGEPGRARRDTPGRSGLEPVAGATEDVSGPIMRRRISSSRAGARQTAHNDSQRSHEVKALIAQRLKLLDQDADHFTLLGVAQDVSLEALRRAYYALARQLHPDRLAALGIPDEGKHAQRLFAQINAGFAVLSDPERRAEYVAVVRAGGAAAIRAEQARAEEMARRILEGEEAFHRGELALRRDQAQAAIAELEQAVQLNPDEADYHAVLAWAKFVAAGDKQAVATATRSALERAIQRSPKAVTARFFLGRVERMLGRDADALRHFRDVIAAVPGHQEAAAELRVLESRKAGQPKR